MELTKLGCDNTLVADLSPLTSMHTLRTLNVRGTKVTPASVAALQKALPDCKIDWDDPAKSATTQTNKPWNTPAFPSVDQGSSKRLPAEEQIKAVSKKLVELNPGFRR